MDDADEEKSGIKWGEIWSTLKDPKCYLTASMLLCCNVAFSSLPVFLPTIIKEYKSPDIPLFSYPIPYGY